MPAVCYAFMLGPYDLCGLAIIFGYAGACLALIVFLLGWRI